MILLRLISWPYFRRRVTRTILTTTGIALGIALFVGMHAANQSVLAAFSRTIDRIAGKTELQVSAGDVGFGEDVLEKIQSATTVRVAVPVIEAVVESNLQGQGNLLVLGIDMTGDRSLRDYDLESGDDAVIDDPLIFLAQPDSLILSKEFAEANRIRVGGRLPLGTVDGPKTFVVRGIMKPSGLASAFGGHLAIMDIYAAQKTFGRGRTFDRIDLAVKPGRTIADCQAELRGLLGSGFDVQPPAGRGQQFEAILAGYSIMVSMSSAFALFIGMFIIYNAFAIAVTERRREIGILRALGATRNQIQWLFLGESAVMGVAGALIGLAFGTVIARAVASSIGSLIADVYGVGQGADQFATSPWVLMLALGIGVATSLGAAVLPARSAARVDPVHALQKGQYHVFSAQESRLRRVLAMVFGATSLACLAIGTSRIVFYAGYFLAIGAAVLATPILSILLSKAIRPVLKWLRPVEGALAADSLIQAPRRTSTTVGALMLSLALVVAFSGMARASYDSIVDWIDVTLNPDLFVMPSQRSDVQGSRFPATMANEIAALRGVARVQMFRNGRIAFRNGSVMAVAVEMNSVAQTSRHQPVAGDAEEMYRKAAASQGLIVSDNLARLQHLTLGEVIEIAAPYGVIRLPIVGIIVDYSDQQGSILMDRRLFIQYWHDESVSDFRVYVASGASPVEVRGRILERYAGRRQVFVLTNDDLRRYILKTTDQWFSLTLVQIAVAVLVAILGIVNTLTVSITDRRQELGVLRAVGALRRQVRLTIWIEALAVGVLGLVLGCALGAVNLYYVLEIVDRDVTGIHLAYQLPMATIPALIAIILSAAFAAALWPAEAAVRGSLVEALEYE